MTNRVVFPAFSSENFEPYEMRQLVSALELRFQSIEADGESLFDTDTGLELDNRYSQVGHTHSESEITDLSPYLLNLTAESIFDLADVSGTPSINQVLQWNGAAFVPTSPSAAAIALGDLSDVSVVAPVDGQVLTYVAGSLRWEPAGSGAGITSFAALTDTDLTGQAQYDLVYNADGSEWQDTAGSLQWNPTFKYLQLANEHSINWRNKAFATTELLQFEEVGTAASSTPLDYAITTLGASFSTTSLTLVTVTGLELTGLTVGAEYLLVSIPMLSCYISSNSNHEFELYDDGVLIPESDVNFEARSVSNTRGRPYFFSRKITVAGDITAKCRSVSSDTTYVWDESVLLALNLDDITATYYQYNEDTTGFANHTTVDVWQDTGATLTFGNGVKNWLVFASVHYECDEGREVDMRLYNGTDEVPILGYTPQDFTDELTVGGIVVLEAPASGTWTIQSRQVSVGTANGVSYSSLCAIDLDVFSQTIFSTTNPSLLSNLGATGAIETASDTTNATGVWLGIGAATFTPGSSSWGAMTLQYNVDAGADVEIVSERSEQTYGGLSSYRLTTHKIGETASVPEGSVLEVELYNNGGGTNKIPDWHAVMLLNMTTSVPGTLEETFLVGDPGYITRIDGTEVDVANNIGINWEDAAGDRSEFLNLENIAAVAGDPQFSEVQLLAKFEGADAATAYTEVSPNAAVATFEGNAQIDTAQFNFGASSLLLDGTGDYVTFPDIPAYDLGTSDWTIEGFTRFNTLPPVQTSLGPGFVQVALRNSGAPLTQLSFAIMQDGFGYRVRLVGDGFAEVNTISGGISTGVQYHWAVTRTGGQIRAYFDGNFLTGDFGAANADMGGLSDLVYIGSLEGSTAMHDGWIDDVRFTIGTARYTGTGTYTIPTTDFQEVAPSPADESFAVGDPVFNTRIDGLTTNITSASTAIDGTLNVIGATDLDSTLNVDGTSTFLDDVDVTGVLEADKVIAGDPGVEGTGITVNGTTYDSVLKASDIGGTNAAQFIMHRHSTTLPALLIGARAKDDTTGHTVMADNDHLLNILAAGWDGVDSYSLSSEVRMEVDGTPGANDMPGQITFLTSADGTETPLERMRIRSSGNVEMDYDLTVTGDFTVDGTLTSINTNDLNIADNIIVLNSDVTGTPSENAGVEVERGTSTNVLFRWNETTDRWEFTNDGSTYYTIQTTHTGEVTGDDALTLDVTSITNRTDVVADAADDVTIHDDSDGLIKKVNLSSITDGGYF